jgi:uncharacterized surface protein with fasciclin (FAS1) repeats
MDQMSRGQSSLDHFSGGMILKTGTPSGFMLLKNKLLNNDPVLAHSASPRGFLKDLVQIAVDRRRLVEYLVCYCHGNHLDKFSGMEGEDMRGKVITALVVTLALLSGNAMAASTLSMAEEKRQGPKDQTTIADLAIATPELSTLVAALVKADLVEFVDGRRQLTVFAPNNDAFDATADALGFANGIELVDALPVSQLTDILTYHVAPGRRDSGEVLSSDQIRTFNRAFVYPSIMGGLPFINDSEIVSPDIFADNGVIHVIGTGVLLPPTE